jgi:hypothetical protein
MALARFGQLDQCSIFCILHLTTFVSHPPVEGPPKAPFEVAIRSFSAITRFIGLSAPREHRLGLRLD